MSRYTLTPLLPGVTYHIYNRGNNREDLFREERNYRYFLQLYTRYVYPIADTFAYCLLSNHFHLQVRIKTMEELLRLEAFSQTFQVLETWKVSEASETWKVSKVSRNLSRHFSNLFNAYTKAINKAYGRTGSLFEKNFKRIPVTEEAYFVQLIRYIHFNPQKHGLVDDFREWPWSSYHALQSRGSTKLARDEVIQWFDDTTNFVAFHQGAVDEHRIASLIGDDFD